MSRAVKIPLTQRIATLLTKTISVARTSSPKLPSVREIPLPGLPHCAPDIPFVGMRAQAKARPAKQLQKPVQQKLFPEKPVIQRKDVHRDIVSLLKQSGYPVTDMQSLPSGENRITLSDLFEDYTSREREYEYVNRR